MTNAGLEPERRRSALRHGSEALATLTALQHKWLLMNSTRPAARDLEPVIKDLTKALGILADSRADHWAAAPVLRSVAQTLLDMANSDLEQPQRDAQLAYEEIAAHRE